MADNVTSMRVRLERFSATTGQWSSKFRPDSLQSVGGLYAGSLGTGEVSLGSVVVGSNIVQFGFQFTAESTTNTRAFVVVDSTTVAAVRIQANIGFNNILGDPNDSPIFGLRVAASSTIDVRYVAGTTVDSASAFLYLSQETADSRLNGRPA